MTKEIPKLIIKFNDIWNVEQFKQYLNDVPKETLATTLKMYYATKLAEYIDAHKYEDIQKLEGILDLHNMIEG